MSGFNELKTLQDSLVRVLAGIGWEHVPGSELRREPEQPLIEADVVWALKKLNPVIAEDPARVQEVLPVLRSLSLASANDGLMAANQEMTRWLRGQGQHQFLGLPRVSPIQLVDFENLNRNRFVVSQEVTYGPPGRRARFDIVLWVNGFPLVVGELKSPVAKHVSWINGAREVVDHYQKNFEPFFVPNVFSFATEGRQLRYGTVGAPVEHWQTWGSTESEVPPGWDGVSTCAAVLLSPRVVLDMLRDFTVFEHADDGSKTLHKIAARYPQYEAVTRIVERVSSPSGGGLVHHTQGSGKTLAMTFAAAKMMRDDSLSNPTIVLVADRLQLVRQTYEQFRVTGMPRLNEAASASHLRQMLASDRRGLIFTTVHKFSDAGLLSERENIIVLVDEAHRTQEAQLGHDMRVALPNARFFGFTGTPIADTDRNTFTLFGDPRDPGHTLHRYDSDQSIADGMTVPIRVSSRLVEFQLDKETLDEEFAELAETEGLSEKEIAKITGRLSSTSTLFANPERIAKVSADMVDHFYSTVDPLGMKAQIVVNDRELCVAYHREITALLAARASNDEAAVVMSVQPKDPGEWAKYALDGAAEEALLDRFRTFGDPLKFLIVTAKLGTGFNAPIEGVLYLDKPMKLHTLFQTITRANRTWRNPETGQDKRFGLICDYVGLGDGFARAMSPANPDAARKSIEVDGLLDAFEDEIDTVMDRFAGIDTSNVDMQTLQDAHDRLPNEKAKEKFQLQFQTLQGIWEAVVPHERLDAHRRDYRFLGQIYTSLAPVDDGGQLLWARLGAKTLALVHSHIGDVTVSADPGDVVIADASTIATLIREGLVPERGEDIHKSAEEVIDSIAARLKRRMAGPSGSSPQWRSLAERLDALREQAIGAARQSIEFLRQLFTLARDVTAAEQADDSGELELLPDPRVGALTQIFAEYAPDQTPVLVARIVAEVDEIVRQVSHEGWTVKEQGRQDVRRALRKVFSSKKLPVSGDLFDRAYAYIEQHY